jgi:hypothetical protein
MSPIIEHPDVARMLMTMKALTKVRPRHLLFLRRGARHGPRLRR